MGECNEEALEVAVDMEIKAVIVMVAIRAVLVAEVEIMAIRAVMVAEVEIMAIQGVIMAMEVVIMVVEEVMEEVTKTLSSHIFVILLYIMPIRTPCSWRHIPQFL